MNQWPDDPMTQSVIEMLFESARKNSAGVAIRRPVRRATAGVKCLVLCVRNQSGRLAMETQPTETAS